jgi:hypothetical protein
MAWGRALRPPRYVWTESGTPDGDDDYADPEPEPAPEPPAQPDPEPADDDSGPAIAAAMRRAKLRWQAERLAELADFFAREKAWRELRNSVSAFRMKFGCGMPTAEQLAVYRELYPSRSGTAIAGRDLLALGRGGRLDPGYLIPHKIS